MTVMDESLALRCIEDALGLPRNGKLQTIVDAAWAAKNDVDRLGNALTKAKADHDANASLDARAILACEAFYGRGVRDGQAPKWLAVVRAVDASRPGLTKKHAHAWVDDLAGRFAYDARPDLRLQNMYAAALFRASRGEFPPRTACGDEATACSATSYPVTNGTVNNPCVATLPNGSRVNLPIGTTLARATPTDGILDDIHRAKQRLENAADRRDGSAWGAEQEEIERLEKMLANSKEKP